MSDYSKSTNFTTKDTLPTGNANKIVKGTEIDIEFTNIASAIASKANSDSPSFTGTPTVPTAVAGTNTTQIASCAFVFANSVPSGFIGMWSGNIASIPSGWFLCNGSNGTPDLRNKFIIGADADVTSLAKTSVTGSATQTGGTKDAVVVSHTHTVTDPGHTHAMPQIYTNTGCGPSPTVSSAACSAASDFNTRSGTTGISIDSAGVSGTNANLPPYFALAFIMKS